MRVRLLMGPGGSGKTPFAQRVASEHDIHYISTGQIFRDAIVDNTELGKQVKQVLDSGGVVDNDIVNKLMSEELFKASSMDKVILIGGYPRNMNQAMHLENLLYHKGTEVELCIIIDKPLTLLVDRVTSRRVCVKCGKLINLKDNPQIENETCDLCGGFLYRRAEDQRDRYMKKYLEYVEKTAPVIENLIDRKKTLYVLNPEDVDLSDWDSWTPKAT